jgi:hypothetical protein
MERVNMYVLRSSRLGARRSRQWTAGCDALLPVPIRDGAALADLARVVCMLAGAYLAVARRDR